MSASGSEEPARLPRLHLVTNDAIVARRDFLTRAATLAEAGGADLAFHLRAPAAPGGEVWGVARELAGIVRRAGGWFIVNDRLDVALAADADGVQLGHRSLAPADLPHVARRLKVGASVHGPGEAEAVGAVDW
ncbi:MAG: thiamine phosphate synthase, partial [Longimicrobiales bacterium]|nr:thiamine phosphate synthase [Longimicrobiales bacterium]